MKTLKLLLVLLITSTLFSSCAIVKPGEVGVRQTFGRLRGNIIDPGLL